MTAQELINEGRRYCYYIPIDSYVEGKGYRPSVVFENESGHFPNGGGEVEPWYWNCTYKEAQQIARERNERLGIDAETEFEIICSSMFPNRKKRENATA